MATQHPASGPSLEEVRAQIRQLYRSAPDVRLSVAISHSRVVQDANVRIVGVYPHVFCVEELIGGVPQRHTFQYADVLTSRIVISSPG